MHSTLLRRCWRGGFTLIELLVVVAIIAVLIAILLPALGAARTEARKSISLANIRSIGQASAVYQADHKEHLPIVPWGVPVEAHIKTWCPWAGWGKFAQPWWTPQSAGRWDIPPSERPLNSYLSSETLPTRQEMYSSLTVRKVFEMPSLRDPSDKVGRQRTWDLVLNQRGSVLPGTIVENPDRSTCYDDVGTSYLYQVQWFFQVGRHTGLDWDVAFNIATAQLRQSAASPSRMIWANDEHGNNTIIQTSAAARLKNGYGDINKSMVVFLDGHARYLGIIPGGSSDPQSLNKPWLVPAFNNVEYSVVFERTFSGPAMTP